MEDKNQKNSFGGWYGRIPPDAKYNYEEQNARFLDRKLFLYITLFSAVACELLTVIALIVRIHAVRYWLFPFLLLLLDVSFFFVSRAIDYCVGYANKYKIFYSILTVILSGLTLFFLLRDSDFVVLRLPQGVAFSLIQVVKIVFVLRSIAISKAPQSPHYLPRGILNAFLSVLLLSCLLLCVGKYGYFGQGAGWLDKQATLVFSLNGDGNYIVTDTLKDGNYLVIPQTLNGVQVVGADASVLNQTKISKITVEGDTFDFYNLEKFEICNSSLLIEGNSDVLETVRQTVFNASYKDGKATACTQLLARLCPNDIAEGKTYYHVVYSGDMGNAFYIPILTVDDTASPLASVESYLYKFYDDSADTVDFSKVGYLKWAFEKNDGYACSGERITADAETHTVTVSFEPVCKIEFSKSNDTVWNGQNAAFLSNIAYIRICDAETFYNSLPTRDGFSVIWNDTRGTASGNGSYENAMQFVSFVNTQKAGGSFTLRSAWILQCSAEIKEAESDLSFTYGDDGKKIVFTSDCILPLTYSLKDGSGTVLASGSGESGKINVPLTKDLVEPLNSGTCSLSVDWEDGESTTTSLTGSKVLTCKLNIAPKLISAYWTIPTGGTRNNTFDNQPYTVSVRIDDSEKVRPTDVIDLSLLYSADKLNLNRVAVDDTSVSFVNASTYRLTAIIESAGNGDQKYQLTPATNGADFTIRPKTLEFSWNSFTTDQLIYDGNKKILTPTVTNAISGVQVDLLWRIRNTVSGDDGGINVGTYYCEVYELVDNTALSASNYTLTNSATAKSGSYSITQRPLTVTWEGASSYVFNGQVQRPNAIVTGLANGEIFTVAYTADTVNAGNYTATLSLEKSIIQSSDRQVIAGGINNYAIPSSAMSSSAYEIQKATYTNTFKFTDATYTYDGTHKFPTLTVDGENVKITQNSFALSAKGLDNVAIRAEIGEVDNVNAGTVTMTIRFIPSSNYNDISSLTATVTITKKSVEGAKVTLDNTQLIYSGNVQTKQITSVVADGLNITYDVTGNTGTNAGSYTMIITANGNFTGTLTVDWSIAKCTVSVPEKDTTVYTYNGKAQTYKINANSLYTVSDAEQTNAGKYTVTVAFADKNNYCWASGSSENLTYDFVIVQRSISDAVIKIDDTDLVYNGDYQAKMVTSVTVDGLAVTYSILGNSAVNAGSYSMTITASGNFTGAREVTWSIAKKTVAVPKKDTTVFTYDGFEKIYTLATNSLYTISGNNQTNAGKYTVTVALADKNNYCWASGSSENLTYDFVIGQRSISDAVVKLDNTDLIYNGDYQAITVTSVTVDGLAVTYTVSKNSAINAGSYSMTITANGNFTGVKKVTWSIAKKTVEKPTADTTVYTYNGKAQTYKINANSLYTVSGATQTEVGTYTVTVSLNDKNNYCWADGTSANLTYDFVIRPESTT